MTVSTHSQQSYKDTGRPVKQNGVRVRDGAVPLATEPPRWRQSRPVGDGAVPWATEPSREPDLWTETERGTEPWRPRQLDSKNIA